jgi:NADPH2:quinone reductase
MKAILSKAPGGPDTLVLEDVADPIAGPGELVIAVKACAVNYPDVLIIEDKYQFKPPRPFSPGYEVAGLVASIGEGVTRFKVGDRIIGFGKSGGMAEQMLVEADRCTLLPDGMSFEEGASLIMTYGTSLHALKDRGRLKAGETLLVLGAAGGVGLAAVELGKAMGARVVAAVSSEDKAELALAHGADEAVVYPSGPFDDAGRKALDGNGGELHQTASAPRGPHHDQFHGVPVRGQRQPELAEGRRRGPTLLRGLRPAREDPALRP